MAKKEFKKMVEHGLWIEELLNPNIKPWEYRELITDGLDLVGVPANVNFSKSWVQVLESLDYDQFDGRIPDSHFFAALHEDFYKKIEKGDLPDDSPLPTMADELLWAMLIKEDAFKLLKKIKTVSTPWEILLASELDELISQSVERLKHYYSCLSDNITTKSGRLVNIRDFAHDDNFGKSGELVCSLHFHVIVANIFFKFLLLGGQEYYLFCEHCGRFTAIQRKGRKKFCSDICRTAYKNARLANK